MYQLGILYTAVLIALHIVLDYLIFTDGQVSGNGLGGLVTLFELLLLLGIYLISLVRIFFFHRNKKGTIYSPVQTNLYHILLFMTTVSTFVIVHWFMTVDDK